MKAYFLLILYLITKISSIKTLLNKNINYQKQNYINQFNFENQINDKDKNTKAQNYQKAMEYSDRNFKKQNYSNNFQSYGQNIFQDDQNYSGNIVSISKPIITQRIISKPIIAQRLISQSIIRNKIIQQPIIRKRITRKKIFKTIENIPAKVTEKIIRKSINIKIPGKQINNLTIKNQLSTQIT